MKGFLNTYMSKHRRETALDSRKKQFVNTVRCVRENLGAKPFHVRGRGINAAVFDSVMVAFSKAHSNLPDDLSQRFQKLLENQDYIESTTSATTDLDVVRIRLRLASTLLFE